MKAEFIHSVATWEYFTQSLARARVVALSVEDSSMRSYRNRLCLLQFHVELEDGATRLAVVDVVAFDSLRPNPLTRLGEIVSPTATVVVHGGEYAVAGLRRDLHVVFSQLHDTQQAAVLLGLEHTGYRNLCQVLLQQNLLQSPSVDWRLRPLAEHAVAAAVEDVAYLPRLWRQLSERIDAAELRDEWEIAGRAVAATPARANLAGRENIWHLKEARALPPGRAGLLKRLVEWREGKAREFDCPPGKVVAGVELCRIAATAEPDRLDGLLAGFHSRLLWSDREEVRRLCVGYEAVAHVEENVASAVISPPPGRHEKLRLQRLKEWRRAEASRRGVGLQAVLPAETMAYLARHGAATLAVAPMFGEARMARYGAALAELLTADTVT